MLKINRQQYVEHERTAPQSKRTGWLDDFANQIVTVAEKPVGTAVDAARLRQSQTIIDDIRSIISKKPVHATVASKVDELQERTGLKEYIRRKEILNELTSSASTLGSLASMDDALKADIDSFVTNKISTKHGNVLVPALQEDILQLFKSRGLTSNDVEDPEFEKYLFEAIKAVKDLSPSHESLKDLGKGVGISTEVDKLNSDFFGSLSPSKM
jgi:hypothetical protein